MNTHVTPSSTLTAKSHDQFRESTGGNGPAALFQGYDVIESGGRSTILKGTQVNGGAIARLYYKVCTDIESLTTALNISASVSASYGIGGGTAKTSFMSSLAATTTSVSIVVYAGLVSDNAKVNYVEFDRPPPEDLDAFFAAYGDSWVSEMEFGAEYICVYTFYSSSVESQQQVVANLKAWGIVEGGDVSADLQTSLTTAQSSITTEQTALQFMTGHDDLPLPTPEKVIDFALEFVGRTPNKPVAITYKSLGYEHVEGVPAGFGAIVETRKLFESLDRSYARLASVRDTAKNLLTFYAGYQYGGDQKLNENLAAIEQDLVMLKSLFDDMEKKPTGSYWAPPLPALSLGVPELTFKLSALNLKPPTPKHKASAGGIADAVKEPFDDVLYGDVATGTKIAAITGRGGDWLDQISVTYSGPTRTATHGGGGGKPDPVLTLNLKEVINKIEYTTGDYIDGINFYTNYGQKLTIGKPKTQIKIWTPLEGQVLIGFAGESGQSVDSISLKILELQPATWLN